MNSEKKTYNYHIVVAAGNGSRYGSELPKQFCNLNGRPLLMVTLERLHIVTPEWKLIVVVSDNMTETWKSMCDRHGFTIPHITITGGSTRSQSVKNALDTIDESSAGLISVHDAARPIITPELINSLLSAIENTDGAIPSCNLTHSIRHIETNGSSTAINRMEFRSVQTPQIFPAKKLITAYSHQLLPEFTDDASVMEAAGFNRICLAEGDPRNIKVTNPGDMAIAELYLSYL